MPISPSALSTIQAAQAAGPQTPVAPGGPVSPPVNPQAGTPNVFNVPPIAGRANVPNPGISSIGAPTGPVQPPQGLPPQVLAILAALRAGTLNQGPGPGGAGFAQGQGGGQGILPPNPFTQVAGVARRTSPMLSGLLPA